MRIRDMLAAALHEVIAFIPNLLAAILVLIVGFVLAMLLQALVRRGLQAAGLERRRSVRQLVEHDQSLVRLPRAAGRIVYWVVALATIGVAVDALDLPWLSAGMARVLRYVPSVLAAGAVAIVGYLLGNFLYRRISLREAGSVFWAPLVRVLVFAFAAFMALQELGIASAIVTTAFTLGLGALAVAAAIAFGLGNRELAGRVMRDWYERRGAPPVGQPPLIITEERTSAIPSEEELHPTSRH